MKKRTPLALGETSIARMQGIFPYIAYPKTPELSNLIGRTANRLFFGSFFSSEKKEHVPPHKLCGPKLLGSNSFNFARSV